MSVKTSILEQIAQAILTKLRALKTPDPDRISVSDVIRPRRWIHVPPADKLLVLYQLDPQVDAGGPYGFSSWEQPFDVSCYVQVSDASTTEPDECINAIRAAVETAVLEDVTWGGLATDTRIDAPERFINVNGSFEGVHVRFTVFYRTLLGNPYATS